MNDFIKNLQELKFNEEQNLDRLKITVSNVEYKDSQTDIQSPDLRYFLEDGKLVGLHISGQKFSEENWQVIEKGISESTNLKVLYLRGTPIKSILIDGRKNLTFINVSENTELKSIGLSNLRELVVLNASFCPNLNSVSLNGRFDSLEQVDVSNGQNLVELTLPDIFPALRLFNIQNTQLDSGLIKDLNCYDIDLKIAVSRRNKRKSEQLIHEMQIETRDNLENCYELDFYGNIEFLDLGHLGLQTLPNTLFGAIYIKYLCLGSYYPLKWGDVTELFWIGGEKHKNGSKRYNTFKSKDLERLARLEELDGLYLNSISLDNLTFLTKLKQLTSLDVSGNAALNDFSQIASLKKLQVFHAGSVPNIEEKGLRLPERIINLSLENTNLASFSLIEKLDKLKFANLTNNKLETKDLIDYIFKEGAIDELRLKLISDFENKGEEGFINLKNNKIDEGFLGFFDEKNFEIKKRNILDFINNYYNLESEIKVKIVKLIITGNTTAGKTTLYDILNKKNEKYLLKADGESTHGLNVFTITDETDDGPKYIIKGYDFGGQDYYHSTHWAYFSNQNTIYTYLFRSDWDDAFDTKGANQDIVYPMNYWLDAITKFTKTTGDKSKVKTLLIQNKYEDRIKDLNFRTLKEDFPALDLSLYDDNNCNLKNVFDQGYAQYQKGFIKYLTENVAETSIQNRQLEFVSFLREDESGILLREKASEFSDKDSSWIKVALGLAHNTYDIIDFQENLEASELLKKYIITDIEKLNLYVFKILQLDKDGYFTFKVAKNRLIGFPLDDDKVKYVLDFMLYNKIAFKIPEKTDEYLAPMFLPNSLSKSEMLFIETFNKPLIEYRFRGFYHGNVFSEVVLEFVEELIRDDSKNWKYLLKKNHVFLHDEDKKRFLYISFDLHELSVTKKTKVKLPVLKVYNHSIFGVKDTFIEGIHEALDGLTGYPNYDEIIKANGNVENEENDSVPKKSTIDKIVFNKFGEGVDYKELVCQKNISETNKASDSIYFNNKFYRRGDFRMFFPTHIRILIPMKKIFISYSKFDEKYKDELKSHLRTLQRRDLIETFDDRDIESGGKFDPIIKQKIRECDIFICLISVNFLNVDYIIDQEIPLAIAEGKTILPIVIKPCDWYDIPILSEINEGEKLGNTNAFNKAKALTLRPEYDGKRDEQGNLTIKELSDTERDFMWLKVVDDIKKHIKA